ncbi:cyclin-like protein [Phakopsora pachyrhizi]|nr:cyclin-like protein [Phakopsora pachyrhizi]
MKTQPITVQSGLIRRYRAYFSLAEVEELVKIQSGKLPHSKVDSIRQQACVFMDKVGTRLGFPRRTIACAQLLYHRFHLFFPYSSFNPHDVSTSCIWLASKLEDTIKKLREIQLTSYQIKNVQDGGNGSIEPDQSLLEFDRNRLVGIERLLLESVCFDFDSVGSRDVFNYLIKYGSRMNKSRDFIQLSFRLAIDSYRTLVGLTFSPQLIALSCLYLTSFLIKSYKNEKEGDHDQDRKDQIELEFEEVWYEKFGAEIDDIEEICHQILDLLISLSSQTKLNQSPLSPSDASTRLATNQKLTSNYNNANQTMHLSTSTNLTTNNQALNSCDSMELTRIKIELREIEDRRIQENLQRSKKLDGNGGFGDAYIFEGEENNGFNNNHHQINQNHLGLDGLKEVGVVESEVYGMGIGRDDVTVRFMFGSRDYDKNSNEPGKIK